MDECLHSTGWLKSNQKVQAITSRGNNYCSLWGNHIFSCKLTKQVALQCLYHYWQLQVMKCLKINEFPQYTCMVELAMTNADSDLCRSLTELINKVNVCWDSKNEFLRHASAALILNMTGLPVWSSKSQGTILMDGVDSQVQTNASLTFIRYIDCRARSLFCVCCSYGWHF